MDFSKQDNPGSPTFKTRTVAGRIVIILVGFIIIAGFRTWFVNGVTTELRFNEGSGTIAADQSGNNHPGTLVNGPTWVQGKQGQALGFDGEDDYVNIADHPNFTLSPTQSYTWSQWVLPNNFNEWNTVWSQTVHTSNFFYLYAHSSTDEEAGPVTNGVSVYWLSNGTRLVTHSNNNVLTAGQWSNITITYNGSLSQPSRFTIYVNGVDVTNRTDVVSIGAVTTLDPDNIRIGANEPYGEFFNGRIDEVRYYRRLLTLTEIQTDMNAANGADVQAPTVSLISPAAGNVSGTVTVSATASDNVGVTGVQFLLDGNNLDVEDVSSPYSISWNTTSASNGSHTLAARARDAAGNTTTSQPVTITVNNDITPPTVSITTPAATVNGTVNLAASAADNVAVAGLQFLVDGNPLGAEDTQPPYTFAWNTVTVSNGPHSVAARARDAAGNMTTSSAVTFTVNNDMQAPVITLAGPSGQVSGSITVTATVTDNLAVAGVQFLVDGVNYGSELTSPPFTVTVNTATLSNGQHSIIGRARDAAGNIAISSPILINVGNDQQPPTIAVESPLNTPVSGTITVMAATSDNVGVAGVQFFLDGANLGTEDLSPPFTYSWNTLAVTNGLHFITARARDAAGNTTMSAPVAFSTFNNRLVAAYSCNENSGSTLRDLSGYSNNGTLANGATWASSGKFGAALLFDGSNDLVNINDANCLDLTTGMTIEAWVYPHNLVSFKTLLAKENGTQQPAYSFGANNASGSTAQQRPFAMINTGGTDKLVTGTEKLPLKQWTHIAATYNGFFLRLYVNGNEVSSTQASGAMPASGSMLRLGGSPALGQYFNGLLDEIRIYNRALTKQEIQTDMAAPITADKTAPTVTMTAPAPGSVTGTINVSANATDNMTVAGVQFLINGTNLGVEDPVAPFTVSWNSGSVPAGTYNLTARARDAAGNNTTSAPVSITVTNNTPVISNINVTSITPTSAVVNWSTNIATNSQVLFGTTATYGLSTLVDSALVTNHSTLISGLVPGTQYHFQVKSSVGTGNVATSSNQNFTSASLAGNLGTLNNHTVRAYPAGSIIPWTPNPGEGYHTVMNLAWNYLLNTVPNDPLTGKPAYYSRSYLNPNTQAPADWPHNPAGMYAMLIESAVRHFPYSASSNVMKLASDVGLWHIDHGMTLPNDNWPSVPYASGDVGSLNYDGSDMGNQSGQGDGDGFLEPDKIGELGYSWLLLYKYSGNPKFRQAAIQAANVLSAKVRTGTMSQSPWPYRVNAHTGVVREDYCSNIIPPIELLDGLIASGLGDTAAYRAARNKAWSWMMTYPMQNNIWAQYFEDSPIQGNYANNLNQLNAMMVARYLLEHPEFDPAWEAHVRGLISWVETRFGQSSFGSTIVKEQVIFPFAMASHTARYASVNALLFERTGDLAAREKAYRSFNWATYMCRPNGVVLDGPEVGNQWFTDGYGDYIRHFMVGIGAVPEWAPANQSHLLRSTSVVRNISYSPTAMNYTTYDGSAVEVLIINFNPGVIKANGVVLPKRNDLSQPGWTLDASKKILRIYHKNAAQVSITAAEPPLQP